MAEGTRCATCTFRNFCGVVVAATFGGAVTNPMFSARQHLAWRAIVTSLKSADAGSGHRGAEKRIFAGAFDDSAPPRISRNIEHRRKSPVDTGRARFQSGDACRFFGRRRVPAAGLSQG